MLGKLARWLRVLGFDAAFPAESGDESLLALARREDRVLLTRDRDLVLRAKNVTALLVESEAWADQVRQILARFKLWDEVRPHTRCPACNVELRPIGRDAAANLVPICVLEKAGEFALCPACGRVFWPGTHYDDMTGRLPDLIRRPPGH
jgi:hypothetical protein